MAADRFNGSVQYYGVATTTIFFYEYFAMLPDEVISVSGVIHFTVETDVQFTDSIRMVVE